MYVDCPMCGKKGAAWEDENSSSFCGECEEKHAESMAIVQAEQDAALKREWCDMADYDEYNE
jgi:hypothetical protein